MRLCRRASALAQERDLRLKKDTCHKFVCDMPGRVICYDCLGIVEGDLDRIGTFMRRICISCFCWHVQSPDSQPFSSVVSLFARPRPQCVCTRSVCIQIERDQLRDLQQPLNEPSFNRLGSGIAAPVGP